MEKKKSTFERVVGVTPEDEGGILDHFKKTFDTQFDVGADGKSIEREKSAELKQCIEGMTRYMHGFLREYDASALDIRPDQVHFIDKDKVPADLLETVTVNERALGKFDPNLQLIFVFYAEGQTSKRMLAHVIAHEMVHFNSFGSLQMKNNNEGNQIELGHRRVGLRISSGGFIHFNELNEAVTEELAIRFEQNYFKNLEYTSPELERDLSVIKSDIETAEKRLEANKDTAAKEWYVSNLKKAVNQKPELSFEAYPDERERLHEIIDDIFDANKDQFTDKEEVFKIFVKGMLTGRLLPLARIIEKTYGRGSFDKLADEMQILVK